MNTFTVSDAISLSLLFPSPTMGYGVFLHGVEYVGGGGGVIFEGNSGGGGYVCKKDEE